MASVHLQDIPYLPDSTAYYRTIRDLPQAVWLDSGPPRSRFGRYDIISADPRTVLRTTGPQTVVERAGGKTLSSANPFDLIGEALEEFQADAADHFPFCGGALGYFGYELRHHLRSRSAESPRGSGPRREIAAPDMAVGLHDWAYLQDHQHQQAWLVSLPGCPASRREDLLQRARSAAREPVNPTDESYSVGAFASNLDPAAYRQKLARIQDYIQAGDCYQVNFAQRFSASFDGDPFAAYQRLRQLLPAPYGAFMEVDGHAILSHSPERFLELRQGRVTTRPIKGTAPRDPDPARDLANARALRESIKDRAENLMIVDLLRNDLGKNCRFGSVQVPELFALESYANVHHLVSTVSGRLREDCRAVDLLKGCFPGGSITGAPKIRAMEIIAELEESDRSVYCGSIGYLSAHGQMDSNIAIRSLVCSDGRIHCWGGGGIVADSDPYAEYRESLAKVNILLTGLSPAKP